LRSAPGPAVALLARHLRRVPRVDPQRLAEALANLDNNDFKVRNQAANDLEAMGEGAAPALRQALANNPTVEVRRRLEQLLRRFEGVEAWRTGRALEVLEQIGAGAARRLLADLAQGSSQASLTLQAQAALERLRR
jgi:hypothetical protein